MVNKIEIIGEPRRHPNGTIFITYKFDYMVIPDEMTFHKSTTIKEIKAQLETSYDIQKHPPADLKKLKGWKKKK